MTNHLLLSNFTVHFNHLIAKETGQAPYSNTRSQIYLRELGWLFHLRDLAETFWGATELEKEKCEHLQFLRGQGSI